jgi:alanyl-tRNA synthetase
LTEDFALEQGLTVDRTGFEAAMEEQRQRARSARQEADSMKVQGGPLADFTVKSEFVGYNELVTTAKVMAIVQDDRLVERVGGPQECFVILDRSPFYAESGGQVSDRGTLSGRELKAIVEDTSKAPHGQHVLKVRVESGELRIGDVVEAAVDAQAREATEKNHTATHLLHKALKEVLGQHANQAGSLVAPERLRFDFSHYGSIGADELQEIERKVNRQIWFGTALDIGYKPIDEAKAMGAMALFGEKYGDIVRVVRVGDYSLELCGGCHVDNTSAIGLFKIVGESGIGSGIRRIEAVTGRGAYEFVEQQLDLLRQSSALLKTAIADVPKRVEATLAQLKELGRENESLRGKLGHLEAGSLLDKVRTVGNVALLAMQVEASDMNALLALVDELKTKLPSGAIVLGAAAGGKVNLAAYVSLDLVKAGLHAGQLVKEAAAICGGGGGGRPGMAQAGGKDPAQLPEALKRVEQLVAEFRG